MSDDEFDQDPLQKHLEKLSKTIEGIVKQRLQGYNDNLVTLVSEMDSLSRRIEDIAALVNYKISADIFISKQVASMVEELDVLEGYLATKDPALKKILEDAKIVQQNLLNNKGLKGG
jgi:hypothetical protein